MLTRKVNEVAGNSFTFMLVIIALAVISTCLTFSLVLSQNWNKLEIILTTALLLSSVLGLIWFSYSLVNQVHTETEHLQNVCSDSQVAEKEIRLVLEEKKKYINTLQDELVELRQKVAVRDLLSRIDKAKNTPEKEKVEEPNTTAFDEDIFGAPDKNQENK